jgi:SPX domain protein involved in polyphosphate accumulation
MVEFGKKLRKACASHGIGWSSHCIAYNELKNLIKNNKSSNKQQSSSSSLLELQETFRYALDCEIEKAVLFVLQEQGLAAAELERLADCRATLLLKVSSQEQQQIAHLYVG